MSASISQSWISGPWTDTFFILLPPFASVALAMGLQSFIPEAHSSPWIWIVFVMGIDVAHVYSTLFRTYFDPLERNSRSQLLWGLPVLSWVLGCLLYSLEPLAFWRVLAYVAVFHFIRQQYGLVRIYSRNETPLRFRFQWIDRALIYFCTGYPILYWHCHLPSAFQWFVEGDFYLGWLTPVFVFLLPSVGWAYAVTWILYLLKEAVLFQKEGEISLPKNAILIGTALSWYLGIVAYRSDLVFTLTNVISHGVPYIALVWMNGKKRGGIRKFFKLAYLPVYLGLILGLAFLEEGLWDTWVWKDHPTLFSYFSGLPRFGSNVMKWLVPLLAVPQLTHYLLDGFIWKLKDIQWETAPGGAPSTEVFG